mgnify:FL=1|jgi:pilus assembly protein TadC|tara:strand:- start:2810 stop:3004 length:195 start_codon:yes stop_codon:yes gene_type:complete
MEKVFSFLGGRKMFFAILLFICATVFLFIGQADFANWSEFVMWIFGIYAVGNAGEHLSNIGNKK